MSYQIVVGVDGSPHSIAALHWSLDQAASRAGSVRAVISAEDLQELRRALQGITVRDELAAYAVDVVRATRVSELVLVGAGPRATQSLLLASRAAPSSTISTPCRAAAATPRDYSRKSTSARGRFSGTTGPCSVTSTERRTP